MQSTPTKKQATISNGLSYTTPERARRDPNDTRGMMALATPEELKAQLASRPRSVRSAVSQGYSFPSRAPLSATRSEPQLGSTAFYHPTSPSPTPSTSSPSSSNIGLARPQGLMPMCDTFTSSPSYSPSSSSSLLSYEHSTASIFAKAQKIHNSYLINWSGYPNSSSSTPSTNSNNSSPRKRGQLDDEDEGIPMRSSGLVGSKAYNDTLLGNDDDDMDEDGDETMMNTNITEQDNDLPLSRLSSYNNQQYSPSLSFGANSNSGSNSASSSISSFYSKNDDIFSNTSLSSTALRSGMSARQVKTLPKRQGLGKTQSLPVDAFMNHMNMNMGMDGVQSDEMQLAPNIFNAQDGF